MEYAIYLRKSRVDLDAEARGEGDTLARHKKILTDLAEQMNLHIGRTYQEIVSGDSVAGRPEMRKLLDDVKKGLWAGVLVVEVERLARGDTSDQGLVAKTFKYSNTKIITPIKTYDPNDEYDEEYFEFSLFMSRREYKVINRRLQRGRIASAKEGNYIGGQVPYGYTRIHDEYGPTLEILEEEAKIVRWIFDQYCNNTTACTITRQLNNMGVPTKKGSLWQQETIRGIITNPVYIGKIRWRNRVAIKSPESTKLQRRYGDDTERITVDGRHPAIISENIFNRASRILQQRYKWPVNDRKRLSNPFATVAKCGLCGRTLIRGVRHGRPFLFCATAGCKNKSIDIALFEDYTLDAIRAWLKNYKMETRRIRLDNADYNSLQSMSGRAEKEIATLEKQLASLHDLLEQGTYTPDMFRARYNNLTERISAARDEALKIADELARLDDTRRRNESIIPGITGVLDQYNSASTPGEKNKLLRSAIKKIIYTHNEDDVSLDIYPILPK